MVSTAYCVVAPCISERDRHFGGTYLLHSQGRNQRKQAPNATCHTPLIEIFGPKEDEGGAESFLRSRQLRSYSIIF
jgi:hypothetical protein